MKILLLNANDSTEPYPVYPIGLDYVAAALAPAHDVRIADINCLPDGTLADTIRSFNPDAVGLSIRNIDNTDISCQKGFLNTCIDLISAVRMLTPAPVIIGGSGFSIFPREIMALLKADYGIIGEGERMALLIHALENGASPKTLPGVITPGAAATAPPPWAGRFDRLMDPAAAHLPFYLNRGGMLNLQTRRGCPLTCIYCTYPGIEGRDFRLIPPVDVARTAVNLQTMGAKYLFITDSVFNADMAHSTDVAAAFKNAGLSIPWGAFFMPVAPPHTYFSRLADAGLTHVEFGTESLSDTMLKNYRKPFRENHVQTAHTAAVENGLHVAHYLLAGGPGETSETLETTLSCAETINRAVFFFFCGMRIYPGTPLHRIAIEEGQIDANHNLLEPTYYQSPHISQAKILSRIRRAAADKPNWIIGSGGETTVQILTRMYEKGYSGPLWEFLIR